jgi:uncharacterized membrane protein
MVFSDYLTYNALRKYLAYALFFGAFAKLRTATISFVISVRPTVRLSAWNNSDATERIFMKFDTRVFFEKQLRKFKFH